MNPAQTTWQAARRALILIAAFLIFIAALGAGIHAVMKDAPFGADFYIFWKAGQTLLVEGQNPYDPRVTEAIQLAIYDRPALPGEDPMPFNYPVYVLLVMLPHIWMDFAWAQAFWLAFNLAAVMVLLILAFPGAKKWVIFTIPLCYNYAFAMVLGNFTVLISAILLFFTGYFVFQEKRSKAAQIATGLMLAWCTAKPQAVWLFMAFILLFSLRRRLYPLLVSFGLGFLSFLALSFAIMPAWLTEWVGHLGTYVGYTSRNRSIIALLWPFFPGGVPAGVNNAAYVVINLALLGAAAFVFYRWWKGKASDFSLLVMVSAATYFLLPNNTSAEQLFLLLPLIAWCAWHSAERASAGLWWAAFWVYSYLAFAAAVGGLDGRATSTWPFLFFAAWIIFVRWGGASLRAPCKPALR